MLRGLRFVAVALAVCFAAGPALAEFKFQPDVQFSLGQRHKRQMPDPFQPGFIQPQFAEPGLIEPQFMQPELVQQQLIAPSEAAAIAQAQYPGSIVVKVKRRGDVFVVTLRTADSVVKVLVSGTDGSVL